MSTWVLLRGLTREAAHWGGFVQQLQQALPQARVVTLDLPGNGQAHRQTSPGSVEAMAQACRDALARQGLAPPFHVLAMSLGAMVAMAWARAAPQEVTAAVLVNTSCRPFNPFYQRLRPANYPHALRMLLPGSAEAAERRVLQMTSSQASRHAAVLADWVAVRHARPVSAANAARQLLAAARYRAPRVAPCALLLLASRGDRLVNSQCSEAIAAAWQCPLQLHPSAGHDLPLDDGPWVVAQVRAWLGD